MFDKRCLTTIVFLQMPPEVKSLRSNWAMQQNDFNQPSNSDLIASLWHITCILNLSVVQVCLCVAAILYLSCRAVFCPNLPNWSENKKFFCYLLTVYKKIKECKLNEIISVKITCIVHYCKLTWLYLFCCCIFPFLSFYRIHDNLPLSILVFNVLVIIFCLPFLFAICFPCFIVPGVAVLAWYGGRFYLNTTDQQKCLCGIMWC